MGNEIIRVNEVPLTTMEALNRSEVDIQIATAKKYPRNIPEVLNKMATYATMDAEVAEDCFYVLKRGETVIEGLSVRMAEIISAAWGNLRCQATILGDDGKSVTARAYCHDLESNVSVCVDVRRRITDKYGKTYSEDMKNVTANAAASIAKRNAILSVVPRAVVKRVVNDVKRVAMGQALDMETSRQKMIEWFTKKGVGERQLLDYLSVTKREEIDKEMVFELRATANAIKEGTTSIEETFIKPAQEKRMAEAARAKAEAVKAKAEKAAAAVAVPKAAADAEEVKPKAEEESK